MAILTAQDYLTQVQQLVADPTNSNFSQTTLLNFINQARTRVALDTHCYRAYVPSLNTIAQQETYAYNAGAIGGTNIISGGANYSSSTAVNFSGGSGTGATGVASITGGVIQNIFMTNWGSGYTPTSLPTISITDIGGGTGASATPICLYNVLDILGMDVLWGTLRINFGYVPFTGFNAYCRAYSNQYETPGIFTLHQGIQKAFIYPIPDQAYVMAWDLITLPTDLASPSSPETQILAPWNDAVQFYAAFLASASLQQYQKAAFWYDGAQGGLYGNRVRQLPATAFSRRIFNPYKTYWPMIRKI